MKGKLDKKLLREGIRLMMEEEWQEVNDEIKKQSHTFSPQFHEKMKRLLQSVDTFDVHSETETDGENRKNRYSFTQQNKSDLGHISFRLHVRYIAVIVLLMVGVSAVALANDDIRKGLYQLQYQFFEDNVTIEATPENSIEKDDDNAASEEFHAYKWKEVPEGYYITFEEKIQNLDIILLITKIRKIILLIICRMMHHIQLPSLTMRKKDINVRFN